MNRWFVILLIVVGALEAAPCGASAQNVAELAEQGAAILRRIRDDMPPGPLLFVYNIDRERAIGPPEWPPWRIFPSAVVLRARES